MSSLHNNRENKPQKGGICVANHTTPIDIVILCNDGCYAMVQKKPFFWTFPYWYVIFHAKSWRAAITANMCLSGGSDTWRFDGSPPESHGEVLSPCLVWESRDERSPPSDQKVSFLPQSKSFQACPFMSFLPVFSLRGCSGAKRGWHFPGSKTLSSFCISYYPNKNRYVLESCYWTVTHTVSSIL